MCLISTFYRLLLELAPVMTAPSFQSFVILITGWLFAGRRTVTGILQAAGAVGRKHHSAFHRFFASAQWTLDHLGLALLDVILRLLPADAEVFLVLDDTLARKRGLKIYGVGMHHDPLLSSRKTKLVSWGHSWVILSVVIRFPFAPKRWFSLPVLFRLYQSQQTIAKRGGRYRTRPELSVEILQIACKTHPGRRFHVLADSTYCGKSVVKHLPQNCEMTGRMHLDAALYDPPPPRSGAMGRPRKRGDRLPSPRTMLEGKCARVALDLYGRHERSRLASAQALWYSVAGARLLRVVAVDPLSGGRRPQAFFSTHAEASPETVLAWYARRWSLEVTIHDTKGYLGFEQPQGWTKRAVERTAPMAMLLYSLIVLWFATHGHRHVRFPYRPWYRHKREPSFADMLTTLRRQCLRETFLETPEWNRGSLKVLHSLVEFCAHAA